LIYEKTMKILKNSKPEFADYLRILLTMERSKRKVMGIRYDVVGISQDEVKSVPPYVFVILHHIYGILERLDNGNYKFVDWEASYKALMDYSVGTEVIYTDGEDDIPDDLFDDILGYDSYKEVVLDALRSPDPVHILFVGPPGTAKTLFLLDIAKLSGAKYVIGSRATKAGIAAFLYEYRPKYLIIDEIDKMPLRDQAVLLSLTETGIISIMMFRKTISFRVDTKVFAACNDERRLARELRDRFIKLYFKEYSTEEFRKLVPTMLVKREGIDLDMAAYIADKLSKYTKSVREAIRVARLVKSRVVRDGYDKKKIMKYVDFLIDTLYSKRSKFL